MAKFAFTTHKVRTCVCVCVCLCFINTNTKIDRFICIVIDFVHISKMIQKII